jgi:hypothetical protein
MVEDIFQVAAGDSTHLPQVQRDHTVPHVLLVPGAGVCAKNCKTGWNARDWSLAWADVLRDLDRRQEVEVSIGGKSYVVRTETKGTVEKIFPACGVAVPSTLRARRVDLRRRVTTPVPNPQVPA